jgi:hypothetical protein
MVQGLFNITKFQLGLNYAHKFEIYTICYVIHGCILVNPRTYIYNYHAFVSNICKRLNKEKVLFKFKLIDFV